MKRKNKYLQSKIVHLKQELKEKDKLIQSLTRSKDSFSESYYLMKLCAEDILKELESERGIKSYLVTSFKEDRKKLEDEIALLKENK